MKELSIEEKAKAYDNSLEKARKWYDANTNEGYRGIFEEIFPALKESEDERIRQKLLFLCYSWRNNEQVNIPDKEEVEKTIDWLEKQGEHANFLSQIQVGDKVTRNEDGVLVNLSQLNRVAKKDERQGEPIDKIVEKARTEKQRVLLTETDGSANIDWDCRSLDDVKLLLEYGLDYIKKLEKQGEQKPTNNLEPKFKVGDWVVFNNKHQSIYKVEKIEDGYYILRHTHGGTFRVCVLHDEDLRLWTLKDAKSGDVICSNDGHGNDSIELIKSITDKKIEFWFCLTNSNRYEAFDRITPYTNLVSRKDATPATKEQRELLFQKMEEAGYKWNAEELKLEKIEQKPVWSKEDEERLNKIAGYIKGKGYEDDADWLKSFKERVQPQPKQGGMKSI